MKILLFLFFIIPVAIFGQSKAEDIKKGIIGLWHFERVYAKNLNTSDTDDECVKAVTYLFKEDGSVSIENTDKSKCAFGNRTSFWSVIQLHDEKGKTRFAIRLVEELRAERASYDGNTFTDEIYMIMDLKESHFSWIPKPQYKRPSASDIQYQYKK